MTLLVTNCRLEIWYFETFVGCWKLIVYECTDLVFWFIDCMEFNAVFNITSGISRLLAHLSMPSWSSFSQVHGTTTFQATGYFPISPLLKERSVIRKELVLSQWLSTTHSEKLGRGSNQQPSALYATEYATRDCQLVFWTMSCDQGLYVSTILKSILHLFLPGFVSLKVAQFLIGWHIRFCQSEVVINSVAYKFRKIWRIRLRTF